MVIFALGGIEPCGDQYVFALFRKKVSSFRFPPYLFQPLKPQEKGFVRAFFVKGGDAIDAYLSTEGKEYITENPKLRNPLNKELISIIASVIAAISALLALFLCYFIYIKIP